MTAQENIATARDKVTETAHAVIDTTNEKFAAAKDVAGEALHTVKDSATDALLGAKDAAATAYVAAKDKAGTVYVSAKETAGDAYATAREKAGTASGAVADGIESNPLVALIGGIAVGVLAGALVPRSQKEAELLAPLGARLGDVAREALGAAKAAGLAAFDEAGFNRDAIRSQVDKLLDSATQAASAASGAAAAAVKKPA